MKKMILKIEDLEERIAPGLMIAGMADSASADNATGAVAYAGNGADAAIAAVNNVEVLDSH